MLVVPFLLPLGAPLPSALHPAPSPACEGAPTCMAPPSFSVEDGMRSLIHETGGLAIAAFGIFGDT
jgi:hypothetical protein